jgi:hypothetical protein
LWGIFFTFQLNVFRWCVRRCIHLQ